MPHSDVATRVAINLLIIALGYAIKKLGVVSRQDGRVLNRLVMYVTLPATNLRAVIGADLSWSLLLLPVLFVIASMVTCWIGRLPARALHLSRGDMGTFVISLCGFMGAMAYPFVEAAYGDEGIRALAVCDLGNAVAIFGVAYYLSFRYATAGQFRTAEVIKKVLTFFPMHAFLIAILLNVGHVQLRGLPGEFVSTLAAINSPLMLLSLGIYLELDLSRQESKVLAVNMIYKYAAGLAIAALFVLALPYRGPLRAVAFLLPLMPTSLSTLIYSAEQKLSARLAAMLISTSMLISLAITVVTVLYFRSAF